MKAISTVIATIMLLMVTVSLVGVFYVFSSTLAGTTTGSGSQQTSQLTTQISYCMQIDSISGNKVYLKNCGKGMIENKSLVVTMDGIKLGASTLTINEDETGTVNVTGLWNIPFGKHNLKISNGAAFAQALVDLQPNRDGLVGSWNFDEGSGNKSYDGSGNGVNLDVKTLVNWVDGKFGKAVQMDPTISVTCLNQNAGVYTNVLPNSIKTLPSGAFTVSWWNNVPVNTGSTRIHLASAFVTGCGTCSIWNVLNRVEIRTVAGDNNDLSYTAPSVNVWHYFTFVFDKTTLTTRMYIDGKQAASGSLTAGGDYGQIQWIGVGVYTPTCVDSIPGEAIDELRIWNKAFAPDETVTMDLR